MTELNDYMADAPIPGIANDTDLQVALRRYKSKEAEAARNKAVAAAEIARVNEWLVDANASANDEMGRLKVLIEEYALRVRKEENRMSISLPDGKVATRKVNATIDVEDEESVVRWAEANGRLNWVKVKKSVVKDAAKEGLDLTGEVPVDSLTGEIIEGLSVKSEGVSVTITTN